MAAIAKSRIPRPDDAMQARIYDRVVRLKMSIIESTRVIRTCELTRITRELTRITSELTRIAKERYTPDGIDDLPYVQIGADAECVGELDMCLEEQIFNRALDRAVTMRCKPILYILLGMSTTFELIKQISANFHETKMTPIIMIACARILNAREPVAAAYADRVDWGRVFSNLAVIGNIGACVNLAIFLARSNVRELGIIEYAKSAHDCKSRRSFMQSNFRCVLRAYGITLVTRMIQDVDPISDRERLHRHINTLSQWRQYPMF